MKKTLLKGFVFLLVFLVSLVVIGKVMNKGHNNMTMEMQPASLPVITMEKAGIAYNQLHGYTVAMDPAFERNTVTVLGENRDTQFQVDTYGREVTGIWIEVRSTDGSRLIENTQVSDYQVLRDKVTVRIALKDLIEREKEYALVIGLELEGEEQVRYYTRVIWSDSLHMVEKLAFVKDFHERLYDKEEARQLTRYLETNGALEDNSSFHKVNIHSSFQQITWGELAVKEEMKPAIQLREIAKQTATVVLNFMVSTTNGHKKVTYQVEEYYRVRYTTDRMYLLDYERTMTQMPDAGEMYANNKLLLGITGEDIAMLESADGNIVVFEVANSLYSYNATTNKLASIFSFYDSENRDVRTVYNQHSIKILDVNEGGNVMFAVYGYMNRGRHEGEVGIQIYAYDQMLNTVEEAVYIPYDKAYSVLKAWMEKLLYVSRENKLYLCLDNTVYGIDLIEKTYHELVNSTWDGSIQVSDNHKMIVWQENSNVYQGNKLSLLNLSSDTQKEIVVGTGEVIRVLGFIKEDVIYGVAREADIKQESTGQLLIPMYKVCIANAKGEVLKEYEQQDIYVTSCAVVDNHITLYRVQKTEDGSYKEADADHIMNNSQEETGKNILVTANIDIYERYVQIQTPKTIDSKTIKLLTPKEVVFEGGRELFLKKATKESLYYVYGPYGVRGMYFSPAKAVKEAYQTAGVVVDKNGTTIWIKGNRVTKNQIMAIKEEKVTEGKSSLAVCLDTILELEGIMSNSQYLLEQGKTIMEILQENMENVQVLDLTGCTLDALLYYVNYDIPVLALLQNGEAVLITGFNEYNVVIMEPAKGTLYKKGMNDSTEWFLENGNCFITYVKME